MCGIVGFLSTKSWGASTNDMKAFHNLLVADTVRGSDGTGLFWVDENGKQWYYKDVGPASEVVDRTSINKFLDNARFAVGHNRAATLGSVDKEHTHPFMFSNVTGVHNGTVSGWRTLGATDATMDSMAIYECINDLDVDEASVTEFLASLGSGAYSLVWYDVRNKSLRFARNSQRPMHMILTTGGDLWFGSERRMLEWCLDRNDIKMRRSWSMDTNTLLTVPVNGGEVSYETYVPKYQSAYGGAANGNYWNAGQQYPNYGYGWRDDDDDVWDAEWWRTDNRSTQYNRTESYNRYIKAVPRKIEVTSLLSVERELPAQITEQSAGNVAKAIRIMLGKQQGDVLSRRLDEYIGEYLRGAVRESVSERGLVRVPVYVCGFEGSMMTGYLEADGAKIPVVMTGHCVPHVRSAIEDIILGGHAAKCPGVMVYGLTIYHHADISYRAGPVTCGVEQIEQGPAFEGGKVDLRLCFGAGHPESVKDNGAVNWNMWSSLQGGLI